LLSPPHHQQPSLSDLAVTSPHSLASDRAPGRSVSEAVGEGLRAVAAITKNLTELHSLLAALPAADAAAGDKSACGVERDVRVCIRALVWASVRVCFGGWGIRSLWGSWQAHPTPACLARPADPVPCCAPAPPECVCVFCVCVCACVCACVCMRVHVCAHARARAPCPPRRVTRVCAHVSLLVLCRGGGGAVGLRGRPGVQVSHPGHGVRVRDRGQGQGTARAGNRAGHGSRRGRGAPRRGGTPAGLPRVRHQGTPRRVRACLWACCVCVCLCARV
jgi:hypothetical protein